VKFLGDVIVFKNQRYLKTALSPKETAFLLHMSLRAAAPGKSLLIRELCHNFWRDSTNPNDRLLHLLTSIKKKLLIPSHLLSVSSRYAVPRLINRGLYITTDYDEFETLLVQISSLERTGEWQFAKRDYLRAFNLIRGAPFAKMYDYARSHS
jgi:hypothetical protein